MKELRPLGYVLWGLLWLLLGGLVAGVPLLLLGMALSGMLTPRAAPITVEAVLVWVVGVPLCAWLFVVFPFALLAQGAIGVVASGMALQEKYRDKQIVEFVGSARYRTMEARIDTPALRTLTAISAVGTIPGWVFAISAMVLTAGFGVLLSVPAPVGPLASAALVTVGAVGAVIGIRSRINTELRKPVAGPGDKYGLTDKYYKGLRYREDKRARDLTKARDAGRAGGDIAAWGAAEAQHALRTYGMAKYNARKGVPGALDAPTAAVAEAMGISRSQAEQFVIDAAAFRGKKPVPVRATQ